MSTLQFPQKKSGRSDPVVLDRKGKSSVTQSRQPASKGSSAPVVTAAEEEVLKSFDLSLQYGPCVGMTRKARWDRAEAFGLQPPPQVRDILAKVDDESPQNNCLWNGRL